MMKYILDAKDLVITELKCDTCNGGPFSKWSSNLSTTEWIFAWNGFEGLTQFNDDADTITLFWHGKPSPMLYRELLALEKCIDELRFACDDDDECYYDNCMSYTIRIFNLETNKYMTADEMLTLYYNIFHKKKRESSRILGILISTVALHFNNTIESQS